MKTKNTIDPIKSYLIDNIRLKNFNNFICNDTVILDDEIGEALSRYAPEYILKDTKAIETVNRYRSDLLNNLVVWCCSKKENSEYARNLVEHAPETLFMPSAVLQLLRSHTDIFYTTGHFNDKDFLLHAIKNNIDVDISKTIYAHNNDIVVAIVEHDSLSAFRRLPDSIRKDNITLYVNAAEKPSLASDAVREVAQFHLCDSLYNNSNFYLTAIEHSADIINSIPKHILEQDLPFFDTVFEKYHNKISSLSEGKNFLNHLQAYCSNNWTDDNICRCMDLLNTWKDGNLYCTSNELLSLFKVMAEKNYIATCIIEEYFEDAFNHLEDHAIDEYRGSVPVESYLRQIVSTWNKHYLEHTLPNTAPVKKQRKI